MIVYCANPNMRKDCGERSHYKKTDGNFWFRVVRSYPLYALFVNDILSKPIATYKFFKEQAKESLAHANLAGEHITGLGGHPPLNIKEIKETFKHDISEILKETLAHEKRAIQTYYELLGIIDGQSVYLEEYARSMIGQEELHALEVEKMLKEH